MPPASTITAQNLTVLYANDYLALEDISFTLHSGTITALIGMNGSGKSTLFKSILGFVPARSGTVLISNGPIQKALKSNQIAYVPQSEEVDWTFPVLVEDVVMMGRHAHMGFLKIPRNEDRELVRDALDQVGLWDYRARQIGELSGGQKKRVFLARALAQRAPIILLDEPFTGVDVTTESAIIDLLKDLRSQGHLILVSTHNIEKVPQFCDEALLLNRRLLALGPAAEVLTQAILNRAFGVAA